MMREMGAERQHKLADSRVLIVGVGGLGCPAAQYLVAAGIGTVVLIDHDSVDLTNLNRQILFHEGDVGKSKVECAARHLQALSSATRIETLETRLDSDNVLDLVSSCDVILDCSDNLRTRYLVGDACAVLKKPCVSAAVSGFDGQLAVFSESAGSPCYRCAFPTPPDVSKIGNCGSGGVIGAFVGVLGSMQALEAIKLIAKFDRSDAQCGVGHASQNAGTVLRCLNGLAGESTEFRILRRPDCEACGDRGTELFSKVHSVGGALKDESAPTRLQWPLALPAQVCEVTPLADSNEEMTPSIEAMAFKELVGSSGIQGHAESDSSPIRMRIIDVRGSHEFLAGHIRGAEHFSLSDILANRVCFSESEKIVLYCASGVRSAVALRHLINQGVHSAVHLSGGITSLVNDSTLIEEGGVQPERTPLAHHPDHFGGLKPRHCGTEDSAPA
jgi:molybdopterin/thiamine biosynthesis adenylyltransferase/rhodanese-related sulfurtransferase